MVARVVLSFVLIAAMVGVAAADKPKLAVLGLEVAGSIDTQTTSHGRLLTDMFRDKVTSGTRFQAASGGLKADLLDEKVAATCDSDSPDCMTKIGTKLKADILIFGKIEKRVKDGKEGYLLAMKSFDLGKKAMKEWGEWVPYSDFSEGGLEARVARGFDALVGKDETVVTPTPTPTPTPPQPKKGGGFPWKTTAYVTTGLTMVAAGGAIYFGLDVRRRDRQCKFREGGSNNVAADFIETGDYTQQECTKDAGKRVALKANVGMAAAGALGAFALLAYYEGFVAKRDTKETPTQTGSRTRKKKQFAVTPILSPDGAGATVRLDF